MTVAGQLYIVSAPSGAGKTSLVRALVERDAGIEVSVSHTTRAPRPGERDGEHYHFVDAAAFERLVADSAFLEHAQVFDRRYGTARATVEARLAAGRDVILEIDWQGARQVRAAYAGVQSVFIVPPSVAELRRRLTGRGQDASEVIERRMRAARAELSHWDEFDYLVVNDDFGRALDDLHALFVAQRLRRHVQAGRHGALLAALLD